MSLVANTKIEVVRGTSVILCLDTDVHLSRVEDKGFVSFKEMKGKV